MAPVRPADTSAMGSLRHPTPLDRAEGDATVFVVDDDPTNRDALRRLLEASGLHVQPFGSAEEFLRTDKNLDAPSCLVLDIRLPGLSGIDLQRQLLRGGIHVPVIFITAYADIGTSVEAMKAGALEFLQKPFGAKQLLDAVRQAIARDRTLRKARAAIVELQKKFDALTRREQEVMGLVVAGLLNKQIAAELGRREITVKIHRAHIMRKMGAMSLPDLVRMADKLGISAPPNSPPYTKV